MTIDDRLQQLEGWLKKEEYPTMFMPKNEQTPYPTLLVELKSAISENVSWRLEINLLPFTQGSQVLILQLIAPLIKLEDDTYYNEFFQEIVRMNPNLPIGAFGFDQTQASIYFKHGLFVKDEDAGFDKTLFLENIEMITFLLENYTSQLYDIAFKTSD